MAGVTKVSIDGTFYDVDDVTAVDYSIAQSLTDNEKAQARGNIDALNSNDLINKANVIIDSASGAVASFSDGAESPAVDVTIDIEPVQTGSGDPSPTNVRPISGWTGANVYRTGFNVWDEEWENGYYATIDGTPRESANYIRSKNTSPILVMPNKEYCLAIVKSHPFVNDTATILFYDSNNQFINYISLRIPQGLVQTFQPPNNAYEMRFYMTDYYGNTYDHDICINISNATKNGTYEPSHVVTYPISWQSVSGTVYGGTLDMTTGLLTVDRGTLDLGTLEYVKSSYIQNGFVATSNMPEDFPIAPSSSAVPNWLCSQYKVYSNTGIEAAGVDKAIAWRVSRQSKGVIVRDSNYAEYYNNNDMVSFKTAMSGVQLVYDLATPQTYQLTPTEVTLLLGENNVWADTGDSTVAYRADTKLYIQKINAPTDDDMIADAQIASGRYFIVGGNLYQSTTTIPAGDAINPGSNCILTNLADALNALNT